MLRPFGGFVSETGSLSGKGRSGRVRNSSASPKQRTWRCDWWCPSAAVVMILFAFMVVEPIACQAVLYEDSKLGPSNADSNDNFGISVSLYENRMLVSAPNDDDKVTDAGSAYIFERQSDGSWTQAAKLSASLDGSKNDRLGNSVSLYGDTALVGVENDAYTYADTYKGRAYVFEPQSDGSWTQVAKLLASDGEAYDQFGNSVSLYNNTALIGAPYADGTESNSGFALIYYLSCGNGMIDEGDSCDDGNSQSNDGCNSTCGVERGWTCTGKPSKCDVSCGDGIIVGFETCDDKNTGMNDGCNSTCGTEEGWNCSGEPSSCNTTCGDGIVAGSEACDDHNLHSSDGCSESCAVETGWICSGRQSKCHIYCGDGILFGNETCDDGNPLGSDGCNSTCGVERGWTCIGEPSKCSGICMDGIVVQGEKCDDGNGFDNDGCGSDCAVEADWSCTGEPSICIKNAVPGSAAGEEGAAGVS